MSTTKTSKEMALEAKVELEERFHGQPWLKMIEIDHDDLGPCLKMKITSMKDMKAAGFTHPSGINQVKVCVYSIGA